MVGRETDESDDEETTPAPAPAPAVDPPPARPRERRPSMTHPPAMPQRSQSGIQELPPNPPPQENDVDTIGDDTLDNSGELPMSKLSEVDQNCTESKTWDQSNTWDQAEDFSASEPAGEEVDYGYEDTNDVHGCEPSQQSEADEQDDSSSSSDTSIDPMCGFKPRTPYFDTTGKPSSSEESITTDSLADIQESFACDDAGSIEYHKAKQQQPAQFMIPILREGSTRSRGSRASQFSKSLSSLPEERELSERQGEAEAKVRGPLLRQPTGDLEDPPVDKTEEDSKVPAIKGSKKDSSSRFRAPAILRRGRKKPDFNKMNGSMGSSGLAGLNSSVPNMSLDYGDDDDDDNVGRNTTHSADAPRSADETTLLASMDSMNSAGSESSSSAYSFGIPGLLAQQRHKQGSLDPYKMPESPLDAAPSQAFMQFNLQAEDGFTVAKNEDVEDEEDDDDGMSIKEFAAMGGNHEMPALEQMEASDLADNTPPRPPVRRTPTDEPTRGAPRVRSMRGLGIMRNNSTIGKNGTKTKSTKVKNENDYVKRFFSFANASFGSLGASSGELLDDSDELSFTHPEQR